MDIGRVVKRGEIYWVEVPQTHAVGSEQLGRRPWVIVSGDAINLALPIVQAIPLSSKLDKARGRPFRILITNNQLRHLRAPNLQGDSLALTEQQRVLSKDRLLDDAVAEVNQPTLARIEAGIRYALKIL